MGKAKSCTPDMRKAIVKLQSTGLSYGNIAMQLGCSKKMIFTALDHFRKHQTIEDIPRKNRPRKTSKEMDCKIIQLAKEDPRKSAADIMREVCTERNGMISKRTIQRRLVASKIDFKTLNEQKLGAVTGTAATKLKGNVSPSLLGRVCENDYTSTSLWQDQEIIDKTTVTEIEKRATNETKIYVENGSAPSRTEASKALGTLLQYLNVNDINNCKNLDDVKKYIDGDTSKSMTTETLVYKDVKETSVDHNGLQDNSIDFASSETTDEPDEKRIIDETFVDGRSRDQYSVYGEHIAHRLRSCRRNDFEIYIAQHNIDDIIFNLSMGHYSRVKSSVNEPQSYYDQPTSTISSRPDNCEEAIQFIVTKKEID